MGLAQKRIVNEYKEKEYPRWKSQIDAAAGFDVPLDVKWDTLINDDRDNKEFYNECFEKVFFRPLLTVIKNVAVDDMGRTALREHLKKISWDASDGSGPHHSSFEGGHLAVKHKLFTNVDDENERVKGWQKMIESVM